MENINEEIARDVGIDKTRDTSSPFSPANMYLMAMGMFAANGFGEKQPSRKHNFQQFLFSLIQKCSTSDEAKEVIGDMQSAVTGTEKLIDSMEW